MDLGLKGRVAIVGGASQGIGYGIASMLAQEGAHLSLFARNHDKLLQAAEQIRQTGVEVFCVSGDVCNPDDNVRLIKETAEYYKRIDILVNNDGAPPVGASEKFNDSTWNKAIQQNLLSVVQLTQEAMPHMRSGKYGRIINITSTAVLQPIAGLSLSVAPWAGVIAYSKTLVWELGDAGITVNTICPGFIETPRLEKAIEKMADRAGEDKSTEVKRRITQIPLGRLGHPNDIAGMVAYLASEQGSFVTGNVIRVDGGMVKTLF